MNIFSSSLKNISCLIIYAAIYSPASHAVVLFEDNFDSPDGMNTGSTWKWKTPYTTDNLFGMMYGQNDIYQIIDYNNAHSGNRVLRLKFDNRNAWCNSCGNITHIITSAEIEASCINVSETGWGNYIYNRTRGWSRWNITSRTSNLVCFNKITPSGSSTIDDNTFAAGDSIKLVKQCGVSGTFGGDINRRDDCDLAINYLQAIQYADFDYGSTLSRRLYILIDESAVVPSVGLKLGYAKFTQGNTIPFISFANGWRLELSAFFGYTQTSITIQRGKWYYIEETWTKESSLSAGDGTYQLYAGEDSSPSLTTPIVNKNGINYGNISGLSIIGNWQHFNDASGNMYIDDILIRKSYIGPKNIQIRPNPVTGISIRPNH